MEQFITMEGVLLVVALLCILALIFRNPVCRYIDKKRLQKKLRAIEYDLYEIYSVLLFSESKAMKINGDFVRSYAMVYTGASNIPTYTGLCQLVRSIPAIQVTGRGHLIITTLRSAYEYLYKEEPEMFWFPRGDVDSRRQFLKEVIQLMEGNIAEKD